MDPAELAIWMARDLESPLGAERQDFHAAQIAASMGGAKVIDLMPRWGESVSDDADAALDRLMGG